MESALIYLLKAAGIMAMFLLVYQIGLKRETLFTFNRQFLLLGIASAFLLPSIKIPIYIEILAQPMEYTLFQGTAVSDTPTAIPESAGVNWLYWIGWAYIFIALALFVKFIGELIALCRLVIKSPAEKIGAFHHIQLNGNQAPFSFFNYIFYNPDRYGKTELQNILEHEIAHGKAWHSVDVIISKIAAIFLWFSPFSWWYTRAIKQNLEFMADKRASLGVRSLKSYQYTLLKVSGAQVCPVLTNQFYNSQIKKRIIMLQRTKSKQLRALKSALLLPGIALFLWSFNTYEVYVPVESVEWSPAKEKVEVVINKNTTDKELKKIKKDLASKGYDFSYTVVRNSDNEIIDLSIDIASKEGSDKTFSNSTNFENDGEPIEPVTIMVDEGKSMVFMGDAKEIHEMHMGEGKNVWVSKDGDHTMEIEVKESDDGKKIIKKKMGKGKDGHVKVERDVMEVEIEEGDDGERTIKVNGEEVSEEEYKALKKGKKNKVRFHKKSGETHGEEIKVEVKEVDGKKIIKVNGEEVSEEEFEDMEFGSGKKKHVIKIKEMGDADDDKNVMIIKSKDGEEIDMDDIDIIGSDEDGFSFVFLDSEEQKNQLFIVDGEESTAKAVKAIPTDRIATVEVIKGDKAVEEYGDKAKNGVVIIKTKNED